MPTIIGPNGQSAAKATRQTEQSRARDGMEPSRFTVGAMEHFEPAGDFTLAIGQQNSAIDVPASGYLRSIDLLVTATTAGNAAAVGYKPDAIFSAISEIALLDVNGTPIITPISGYELYLINKFGGYLFDPRVETTEAYTVTSGAGATGGSFRFWLRIPVEVIGRDAIGALANQSSAAQYRWRITIGSLADIYTVNPTNAPSINIKAYVQTWTVPPAIDPVRGVPFQSAPPFLGTTQGWSKQVLPTVAGSYNPQLKQVGNLIRTLIFICRDSAGARVANSFPDYYSFEVNGIPIHNQYSALLLRSYTQAKYGWSVGAAPTLDTGVYVLEFTSDFDGHPGGELRDQWLRTGQGARVELRGSFGAGAASGTLTVLTCDVRVPANVGAIQG